MNRSSAAPSLSILNLPSILKEWQGKNNTMDIPTKSPTLPPPDNIPAEENDTHNTEFSNLPKNRFELELEFIQSLASPAYLHHLATQNYFTDPQFLSFLRYLNYWKQPAYAKYLRYPHCLFFLDLICNNETFCREMSQVSFRNFVHEQQFYNWQYRSRVLYGSGEAQVKAQEEERAKKEQEQKEVEEMGQEDGPVGEGKESEAITSS